MGVSKSQDKLTNHTIFYLKVLEAILPIYTSNVDTLDQIVY